VRACSGHVACPRPFSVSWRLAWPLRTGHDANRVGQNMICFEIQINGKTLCTAGIGRFGVLQTSLHWVKRRPGIKPNGISEKDWCREELHFHVGGQNSQNSLKWLSRQLKLGDEITVRIVERAKPDKPKSRKRAMRPPKPG
jgi:hypothetical protein